MVNKKRHLTLWIFTEQVMFGLLLIGFGGVSWYLGGVDFRGYYAAALAVRQGLNPYDYQLLAPILENITGYVGNNPYYYPPYYVFIFIPLTLLNFQVARAIWLLINVCLFYISLELSARLIHYRNPHKWLLYIALLIGIGAYCLRSEQTGILLFFGLSLTLWAIEQRKMMLVTIGFAILFIKPQVTLFAIIAISFYLLLKRDTLPLMVSGGFLAVLVGLSTFIVPWYKTDIDFQGLWQTNEGSTRVNATLYDYLAFQHGIVGQPWIIAIAIVTISVIIWVALWYSKDEFNQFVIVSYVGGLVLTPYALQYDYVPLALVVMWIINSGQSTNDRIITGSLLLCSVLVLVWQEWSYQGYLQAVFVFLAMLYIVFKKRLFIKHKRQTQ